MFTPHALAPDPAALGRLCAILRSRAPETVRGGPWQSGGFAALASAGCLAGFLPRETGGTAATEPARLTALAAIAEACLTTALALSQWAAACRIIEGGAATIRQAWLPPLARGEALRPSAFRSSPPAAAILARQLSMPAKTPMAGGSTVSARG